MESRGIVVTRNDPRGLRIIALPDLGWETGPGDPNYDTQFQGASAHTFADLGFSVGTGPGQLHVSTGMWTDPSGLIFGAIVPAAAHIASTGTTVNKLNYGYTQPSVVANPGNARDYSWIQNVASNLGTDPSLDQPWVGNVFDLGGPANQAVVFPIVDHGPLPSPLHTGCSQVLVGGHGTQPLVDEPDAYRGHPAGNGHSVRARGVRGSPLITRE